MSNILRRFPAWAQIAPVYGVISIVLYAWTLMYFFWEVPSWLHFLHAGEILLMLAYALATNLLESLAMLCGLLLLALVLPARWFRDVFIARGAALSLASLGYVIFLAGQFSDKDAYPGFWLRIPTLVLIAGLVAGLVYLCGRNGVARKVLEVVADRVSIFIYILAPLSVVSLLVVFIRAFIG